MVICFANANAWTGLSSGTCNVNIQAVMFPSFRTAGGPDKRPVNIIHVHDAAVGSCCPLQRTGCCDFVQLSAVHYSQWHAS